MTSRIQCTRRCQSITVRVQSMVERTISSSLLYLAMSLLRVLMMMRARIPVGVSQFYIFIHPHSLMH